MTACQGHTASRRQREGLWPGALARPPSSITYLWVEAQRHNQPSPDPLWFAGSVPSGSHMYLSDTSSCLRLPKWLCPELLHTLFSVSEYPSSHSPFGKLLKVTQVSNLSRSHLWTQKSVKHLFHAATVPCTFCCRCLSSRTVMIS